MNYHACLRNQKESYRMNIFIEHTKPERKYVKYTEKHEHPRMERNAGLESLRAEDAIARDEGQRERREERKSERDLLLVKRRLHLRCSLRAHNGRMSASIPCLPRVGTQSASERTGWLRGHRLLFVTIRTFRGVHTLHLILYSKYTTKKLEVVATKWYKSEPIDRGYLLTLRRINIGSGALD